jgi:hypothetical protein
MSIPIPLAVRISNSRTDVHVTRHVSDLVYREVAKGGYSYCTFSLHRSLLWQPDELQYYSRVYVYDGSGSVVWEGRLEDLGPEAGSNGHVWRVTAMGPSAHASDITQPRIWVDRDLSRWIKARSASLEQQTTTVSAGDDPGGSGAESLVLSFPTSMTVPTNGACTSYYLYIEYAGQELAVLYYAWDAGLTSADWRIRGFSSGSTVVRTQSASTAGGAAAADVVTTDFSVGDNRPLVQFRWEGAASGTGTGDIVWASIKTLVVRAITYSKSGSKITSGYSSADITILASDVVADLLGCGMLDEYDGANAEIDTTSYAITQLAEPEGTTAAAVLDQLMEFEPAYRWGAYESNSAGKYRFRWVLWPSQIRYEATTVDDFSSPASADQLWNACRAFYTTTLGLQSVRVTSTVPELDDAGLTREASITLPPGSTSTDATRAAEEFLEEHARPPAAGTLKIARPVFDRILGRWVQPWQIAAGELISVRDVQPTAASLTATARDGLQVFRIASREYRTSDAAATLELDEYSLSTARALAAAAAPRRKGKIGRRRL